MLTTIWLYIACYQTLISPNPGGVDLEWPLRTCALVMLAMPSKSSYSGRYWHGSQLSRECLNCARTGSDQELQSRYRHSTKKKEMMCHCWRHNDLAYVLASPRSHTSLSTFTPCRSPTFSPSSCRAMQLTFHIVMKSRSRRSSRDVNLERQSTLWNATIARCVLRRKVLLWIDGASILASTIIDLLEASNTVQTDRMGSASLHCNTSLSEWILPRPPIQVLLNTHREISDRKVWI